MYIGDYFDGLGAEAKVKKVEKTEEADKPARPKWHSSIFQAAAVAGLSYLAANSFAHNERDTQKYFVGIGSLAALFIFLQGKKLPEFAD